MNCDLLLYWMTHAAEGPWQSLRRSVKELAPSDADIVELCRRLRVSLSDLGYADFFIGGTQKWLVLPPGLGGLAMQPDVAVLWGGRTPALLQAVKTASEKCGCRLESKSTPYRPTGIFAIGPGATLAATAQEVELSYAPNLAAYLSESLDPIPRQLDQAAAEPAPRNWKACSFDLQSRKWVEGLLPRSACEFSPTYGNPKYFVRRRRGRLLRLRKREAVYASAFLQSVRLITYDAEDYVLSSPLDAPLPEPYARVACLCSGQPAEIGDGRLIYRGVPYDIAAILMVAAGQPHPAGQTPVTPGEVG